MVGCELCPNIQHSQKGAVPFLKRCIALMVRARYNPKNLLVRLDSEHDTADFIATCQELGDAFIVKRNPRLESLEQAMDAIRCNGVPIFPRPGKTVLQGIRTDISPSAMNDFSVLMAIEATEQPTLANGEKLLIPEVKVDSWWPNLPARSTNE